MCESVSDRTSVRMLRACAILRSAVRRSPRPFRSGQRRDRPPPRSPGGHHRLLGPHGPCSGRRMPWPPPVRLLCVRGRRTGPRRLRLPPRPVPRRRSHHPVRQAPLAEPDDHLRRQVARPDGRGGDAVRTVFPGHRPCRVRSDGCHDVKVYSKHPAGASSRSTAPAASTNAASRWSFGSRRSSMRTRGSSSGSCPLGRLSLHELDRAVAGRGAAALRVPAVFLHEQVPGHPEDLLRRPRPGRRRVDDHLPRRAAVQHLRRPAGGRRADGSARRAEALRRAPSAGPGRGDNGAHGKEAARRGPRTGRTSDRAAREGCRRVAGRGHSSGSRGRRWGPGGRR